MPKILKEREIVTSVSKESDQEEVKEELTQLLLKTVVKRGISLLNLIVTIAIICVIIVYLHNR